MTATRGFVGAAGLSRMTSGVTAAEVGATLSRTINGVGAVGIGVSVIQANQALAAGDTPTAALSGLDAVAGVAAFIPGPDIAAAAYGLTRIVGDIALGHTKPRSVMADLETLSKAGCL